jgi:hypothetical protein
LVGEEGAIISAFCPPNNRLQWTALRAPLNRSLALLEDHRQKTLDAPHPLPFSPHGGERGRGVGWVRFPGALPPAIDGVSLRGLRRAPSSPVGSGAHAPVVSSPRTREVCTMFAHRNTSYTRCCTCSVNSANPGRGWTLPSGPGTATSRRRPRRWVCGLSLRNGTADLRRGSRHTAMAKAPMSGVSDPRSPMESIGPEIGRAGKTADPGTWVRATRLSDDCQFAGRGVRTRELRATSYPPLTLGSLGIWLPSGPGVESPRVIWSAAPSAS